MAKSVAEGGRCGAEWRITRAIPLASELIRLEAAENRRRINQRCARGTARFGIIQFANLLEGREREVDRGEK